MTPVTLGKRTFTNETELASYLNTTSISTLQSQFPDEFFLTPEMIQTLGTESSGFIGKLSADLAYRLLSVHAESLSGQQLAGLNETVFNKLHPKISPSQLDAIPRYAIINFLNIPKPSVQWGITIAQWLPADVLPQIQTNTPKKGFFSHLSPHGIAHINPAFFSTMTIHTYWRIFENLSPGLFPQSLFSSFIPAQIQNIHPDMLSSLVKNLLDPPQTHVGIIKRRLERLPVLHNVSIRMGFLKSLSSAQRNAISPQILRHIHLSNFRYISNEAVAEMFLAWSTEQLKSLPLEVFKILNDVVAMFILQKVTSATLLAKLPSEGLQQISNLFFDDFPAGLTNEERRILNELTPQKYQVYKEQITSLLKKLTPGDARLMNTDFFRQLELCLPDVPPLFFKGLSAQQIAAIPPAALNKINENQFISLNNLVLALTPEQTKILPKKMAAQMQKDARLAFEKRSDLQWMNSEEINVQRNVMKSIIATEGDSAIDTFYSSDLYLLIKYDWNELTSEQKGLVIAKSLYDTDLTRILTKEQFMALDETAGKTIWNKPPLGIEYFIANLIASQQGRDIHEELLRNGFYDKIFLSTNAANRIVGSADKYKAQIIMMGEDRNIDLSSVAYALKMSESVPTIIYRQNNSTGVPELLRIINGNGQPENNLIQGKQSVRTYLIDHSYKDYLLLGDASPPMVYQMLNTLWNQLAPDTPEIFTKLSIMACESAEPPRLVDPEDTNKRLPNSPTDWDNRFTESFLGKLSSLFFENPSSPYRKSLKISAFTKLITTNLGQSIISEDKSQFISGNKNNKIETKWDATTQKIKHAQAGPEIGKTIDINTLKQPHNSTVSGPDQENLYKGFTCPLTNLKANKDTVLNDGAKRSQSSISRYKPRR